MRDGVEAARLTGRVGDDGSWGRRFWIHWALAEDEDAERAPGS